MEFETLISLLSIKCRGMMNSWDTNLIDSFNDQLIRGHALTEKQATLGLKILKRQADKLTLAIGTDIKPYIETPIYKYPFKKVNSTKKISINHHPTYGKIIKVEFPYNDQVLNKIRDIKNKLSLVVWDKDLKYWVFSLDETSIQFLMSLIDLENFEYDEEFEKYTNQIREIKNNIEKYVPTVTIENKKIKFLNVFENLPQPNTDDLVESLFLARKLGIFTWTNEVEQQLSQLKVSPLLMKFLNHTKSDSFVLNLQEHNVFSLGEIIKYLTPCLFLVPGGNEFDTTITIVDLLKGLGVHETEISVLFRLPSNTDREFNDFVRENSLNSPLSDKTRAVLVSQKIPKPVYQSNIKFQCAVNFSDFNTHYTMRQYLAGYQNIIEISNGKSPTRQFELFPDFFQ
jgi:hypothetical protein